MAGLFALLPILMLTQSSASQAIATPAGPALVRGRVTEAESGTPLAGFRVVVSEGLILSEKTASIVAMASTDANGRYEIAGLPPNSYVLTALPPEHVATHLGQDYRDDAPISWRLDYRLRPVVLTAGAVLQADFALRRGSAIEGLATSEDGDPLANVWVVLERLDRFAMMQAAATDDRGYFRHFGLPAGRFRLCIIPLDRATADEPAQKIGACPGDGAGTATAQIDIGTGQVRQRDLAMPRGSHDESVATAGDHGAGTADRTLGGGVFDRQTGQPLPRARVDLISRISDFDKPPVASTVTDAKGHFTLSAPATSPYLVRASPPRQVRTHLAQLHGLDSPHDPSAGMHLSSSMLLVADSANVSIGLWRAGTVAGRVSGENGEPLARISVSIQRVSEQKAEPIVRATDDRGWFRLFGLLPGRYRVCAAAPAVLGAASTTAVRRTCYPDGNQELDVASAGIEGVEIVMGRDRVYTVAGVALDSSGASLDRGEIEFADPREGVRLPVERTSGGRFTVRSVEPGTYRIVAKLNSDSPIDAREPEAVATFVTVGRRDISDLVVQTRKAPRITGVVRFEGGVPATGPGYLQVRVRRGEATYFKDLVPVRTAIVKDDLTFDLVGVLEPAKVDVIGEPRGWMVKSVVYRGRDVTGSEIEFDRSSEAQALEIVLTDRAAHLVGRVAAPRGPLVVAVIPTDRARWSRDRSMSALSAVKADGSFELGPIQPGEYFVFAVPPETWLDDLARNTAETMERAAQRASRVVLAEGERRSVTLVVDDRR